MKKIGIIGAMEVEISLLKDLMTPNEKAKRINAAKYCGTEYFEGLIDKIPIVVAKSGVGKVNAALCALTMIYKFGVTHIINTGIAGAVGKGLDVLDFVVSAQAVYHDMDATGFGYKPTEIPQMQTSCFIADKTMIRAAQKAFDGIPELKGHKLMSGRIASGDQFISDKQVKNRIREICNPLCVEMEGASIAHTAFVNDIPFVIIRCMSDMADDGHESVYSFNETNAAKMSAALVQKMIKLF